MYDLMGDSIQNHNKLDAAVGVVIFSEFLGISTSINLPDHCSALQAVVSATQAAVETTYNRHAYPTYKHYDSL